MKMRIAVEFTLDVSINRLIKDSLDDFVEDFCKTMVDSTNDICKEYGTPVSLGYIGNAYSTDGKAVLDWGHEE